MSTLTLKELSAPAGEVIKIAAGKTLDLNSQGTVVLPTIPAAKMPTGSVIQVVEDSNETQLSTSTTAWVDTPLSVTLTPSSTSSKVHLQYSFRGIFLGGTGRGFKFRILRDSTSIHDSGGPYETYFYSTAAYLSTSDIALDSPTTTSAITYKVQVASTNTNPLVLNYNGWFKDTFIAMEIQG